MAAPFAIRRRAHNSKAAILLDHQTAGIPLVRVGGIRNGFDANVREDFTTAVLAPGARTGVRSGTDWLDAMIRKSLRDDFAAKAMQGMFSNATWDVQTHEQQADDAYFMADCMLKSRDEARDA